MASAQPSLDTVITVKVNYEGVTRRAKMPLRDTAPRLLEEQVRTFLHIPADSDIILERYSDSAGAYVLLEPGNASIYKQLYRAAKAKSKLKLRVTVKHQEEAAIPQAVSVEDASEDTATFSNSTSTETKPLKNNEKTSVPQPQPQIKSSGPAMPSYVPPVMSKIYESSFLTEAAKIAESSDLRCEFQARVAGLGADLNKPLPAPATQPREQVDEYSSTPVPECARFAICCNSCEKTTPDVHYHCSTCDDGDFDLCQSCVDAGITCHGSDHWLIKRTHVDGQVVTSTTETIAPKPKPKTEPTHDEFRQRSLDAKAALSHLEETMANLQLRFNMRYCNSCIQEQPEQEFLHCQDCEDYDLCKACFARDAHGHHPKHAFAPAAPGTSMPDHINGKMTPGRNQVHHAICDGCDSFIRGVRHKCLDCPDWDFCSKCIPTAGAAHPGHRFVPIYEPLKVDCTADASRAVHVGICCDGPLCSSGKGYPAYIRGIRYKCAVCPDVDYCASCEASPLNSHSKSHPLIKFHTPVSQVSVTTYGEHSDGQQMPVMGDRLPAPPASTLSINAPQTVVDTKPQAPFAAPRQLNEPQANRNEKEKVKPASEAVEKAAGSGDLRAVFLRDEVCDGAIMPPGQTFEQTWVLRNEGKDSWPAGCSVKFVGGDYMGHVDSSRPARTSELVEASESNVCYAPVAPGQEFSFTVLLRTPPRPGKVVSYWRLTTPDGFKFGHRLWCDVNVRVAVPSPPNPIVKSSPVPKEEDQPEIKSSQMIFPKLEKESPMGSMHEETTSRSSKAEERTTTTDDLEECSKDEWDESDDDFLTDEEYDILSASDEEFLEEQQKKLTK